MNLLQFADEGHAWVVGVEPKLRTVSDGRDDHGLVKEAKVGRGDAFDGIAKDSKTLNDGLALGSEEVDVMSER